MAVLHRKAAQKGPEAMPLWQLPPAWLPLTGEEGHAWDRPQQCLLLTATGLSLANTGCSCSEEGPLVPSSKAVGNAYLQMGEVSLPEGLAWMTSEQASH